MSSEQLTKLAKEIIFSSDDLWPAGLSEADEVSLLKEIIRLKRELAKLHPSNN